MIKFLFILLISYFSTINVSNGQLNIKENLCLSNIFTKLELSIQPTHYCSLYYAKCDGEFVTVLDISSSTNNEFSPTDFQCFSKLSVLSISSLKVYSNFLKGPFNSEITLSFHDCFTTYSDLFTTPIHSNITFLAIDRIPPQSSTINIYLSYLNRANSFIFTLKILDSSTDYITLTNDLATNRVFNQITMDLKDLPPMGNIITQTLNIRTFNAPTSKGLSNIPTLKYITNIYIFIQQGFSDFSEFSLISNPNNLKILSFSGNLLQPSTGIIGLTNLSLLDSITLLLVSNNFNYQGTIPLILPQTVRIFSIGNGLFSGGIKEFLSAYPKINSFSITSNQINGNFSDFKNDGGKYQMFSIGWNNFEGTVDSSWCTTLLTVSRNILTGDLPSCFACHLFNPTINNSISQNLFNPIQPCTTLIPNLRFNSSNNFLYLYGDDLGFYTNDIKITSSPSNSFTPSIYSKLFVCDTFTQTSLPDTLEVFFKSANQTFTLSTLEKPPSVSLVTVSSQSALLFFDGLYFNYNKSSIKITIDNNFQCLITQTTFSQVTCLIQGIYEMNSFVQISIVVESYYTNKLKNLQTTFFAYLNQSTSVYQCQTDCISLGGICNTLIGQCSFNCPNDCTNSLSGSCNTSTGNCICNPDYQGLDCSLPLMSCPVYNSIPCNGGSNICQNQTGTCQCSSNYQGSDCSIPFKPCTSDCSAPLNQGICNNQTGTCQCSSNYQGLDCSIPYIPCTSDCSAPLNQGSCNNQTGVCKCISNYQGSNCTIPSHYITSVIPCSIDGGEVSINGWFGNDQDGTHTLSSYNVLIGNLNCIVTSINQSTIQCNLGAGTGTKNIKITNSVHSNVVFNGNGLFNYQNPIKSCPNSCTSLNNGKCNSNTGECQCNDKFRGFDCSTPITIIDTAPTTNTSIDKDTGEATISNQNTNYEISIISLNEISIDGSIIKSHPLKGNWSIDNSTTTSNSNIFKFSQQLINNTCTITYTIEEIKLKDKSFTFGTTTFTVEKDSIKLSVLVKDYQYQSSLNTLQLIFYSAVGDDSNSNKNDCNKQETSIDTSNANNQQVSNYIQISKNSKTLVGRFINQVIADSRPTFMSSTIINDNNNNDKSTSSIKIGLNLPHCNECLIDPDFSILVSPDFKDSCDQSSNKNKWLIPVAVVVPVVGCAAIAVVSILLFKKYKYNIKFIAIKLKPFKK
ncbi:hypothetical protein ACTFIV_010076 [Dictyostelium citrinum]